MPRDPFGPRIPENPKPFSDEAIGLVRSAMAAQQQYFQRPMGTEHAMEWVVMDLIAERDRALSDLAVLRKELESEKGVVSALLKERREIEEAAGYQAYVDLHRPNGVWRTLAGLVGDYRADLAALRAEKEEREALLVQGAREERERIIALLSREGSSIFGVVSTFERDKMLSGDSLRVVLEAP